METTQAVTEICSVLEYLLDRGECGPNIKGVIEHVRYTTNTLDEVHLIVGDRVIKVTAEDVGAHEHEWDDEGMCYPCHEYNEDFDIG